MRTLFACCIIGIAAYCPAAYAQRGNQSSYGPGTLASCPKPPVAFNPYSGNVHREVTDLQVWGSVGEVPLQWKRYYNSREMAGWTYSFQYLMADAGADARGNARIDISLPQGGRITFTQSRSNPSAWLPVAGVQERLAQQSNGFMLKLPNGHRYYFAKLQTDAGVRYQLRRISDALQNEYRLTYNNKNLLSRITEPAGRYLSVTYEVIDGQDVISKVSSGDGRSVSYHYTVHLDGISSWPLLTSVRYGDGTQAIYQYHVPPKGQYGLFYLAHATDPRIEGRHVDMRYNYNNEMAGGYIKEEINGRSGEVMSTLSADAGNRWICYANGRIQHIVMPEEMGGKNTLYADGLGRALLSGYDERGYLQSKTDALGRKRQYVQSIHNNPQRVTHPDGSQETWLRDELDLVMQYTDQLGRTSKYTRDHLHRLVGISYADGSTERFTYNDFGQLLTHVLPDGGMETYRYDSRGLKTSFTNAMNEMETYAYDDHDLLAASTDARGNTTRYEYNERGLTTKVINADNSYTLHAYDDFGNLTATTNELGHARKMAFDEFKRMISSRDELNRETSYGYDLAGGACGCSHDRSTLTRITYPDGSITRIEYDVEWQPIKEIKAAGTIDEAITAYEYDAAGNMVTKIDPRNKIWKYEYDSDSRMTAATDPLGNTSRKAYDKAGNITSITRPDGQQLTYQYDGMDRLIKTTDANGQLTTLAYDRSGNISSITDAKNNTQRFEYDPLHRKTRIIHPDGSSERYAYDAAGNVKQYVSREGKVRSYRYDSRNREVYAGWNDETPSITRKYDAAGRLLEMSGSASTLSYTYDAANHVLSETQHIHGSAPRQIRYRYNARGYRDATIYPQDALSLTYQYTARNQTASIAANGATLVSYGYDRNDNRIAQYRKNAAGTAYSFDDANRLLSITHQVNGNAFARFEYTYDKVNRRASARQNTGGTEAYSYDNADQLTAITYGASAPGTERRRDKQITYAYDATGNRTSVTDNGNKTGYEANRLNQYTAIGGSPATYTANGNLQSFDGWVNSYDAQNRLVKAVKKGMEITFAYDGRNRCVSRTVNGATTLLYYDEWSLIEEMERSTGQLTQYILGARVDELLLKRTSEDIFYHGDANGNVTHLTNAAGAVVEQYAYDVFGRPSVKDGLGNSIANSAVGNRFLFAGREYIKEAGIYDFRNRMYWPQAGRFLQPDPTGLGGKDINLYRFANNDPVNRKDPFGTLNVGGWIFSDESWMIVINEYATSTEVRRRIPNQSCECIVTVAKSWVVYQNLWGFGFTYSWTCANMDEVCEGSGCDRLRFSMHGCAYNSGDELSTVDILSIIGVGASIISLFR